MDCCGEGFCGRCKGMTKVLVGILMLLNLFVWPMWKGVDGWLAFFAVLAIIGGVIKAVKPGCGCCTSCEMPETKKKKK